MRKFLPVVSFLSVIVISILPVWGQEFSDIDTLSIPGNGAYPGDTVFVPVDLVNTFDVTGFGFRITYDSSAFLPLEVVTTSRSSEFDFFGSNLTEPGVIGFVATSMRPRENAIPPGFGSVAMMTILLKDYALPGTYDFIFEDAEEDSYDNNLSDTNATLIIPVLDDGQIEVFSQTEVSDTINRPVDFELWQNYPNPFNLKTMITFYLAESGPVSLEIYDIVGRKVATAYSGMANPGENRIVWDGRSSTGDELTSGIFFYELKTMWGESVTKRMTLLK